MYMAKKTAPKSNKKTLKTVKSVKTTPVTTQTNYLPLLLLLLIVTLFLFKVVINRPYDDMNRPALKNLPTYMMKKQKAPVPTDTKKVTPPVMKKY
jgi:hypothetical protein